MLKSVWLRRLRWTKFSESGRLQERTYSLLVTLSVGLLVNAQQQIVSFVHFYHPHLPPFVLILDTKSAEKRLSVVTFIKEALGEDDTSTFTYVLKAYAENTI